MEVEAETDRRVLCEKIVTSLDLANAKNAMAATAITNFGAGGFGSGAPDRSAVIVQEGRTTTEGTTERGGIGSRQKRSMQNTGMKGAPKGRAPNTRGTTAAAVADDVKSVQGGSGVAASIENINIATYVCDFGNVVVGSTKKRTFLLTNVGKLPVSFNFDKRVLTESGIQIEPEKVAKIGPNSSQQFNVVYTTRKSAKYGPTKHTIPIDVKGGPQYNIKFTANLTIPELSMSEE